MDNNKIREEIKDLLLGNNIDDMLEYIDMLAYNAYIAGVDGTKGMTGLNLTKDERAGEYLEKVGLRT